jgi:hypothetical protein
MTSALSSSTKQANCSHYLNVAISRYEKEFEPLAELACSLEGRKISRQLESQTIAAVIQVLQAQQKQPETKIHINYEQLSKQADKVRDQEVLIQKKMEQALPKLEELSELFRTTIARCTRSFINHDSYETLQYLGQDTETFKAEETRLKEICEYLKFLETKIAILNKTFKIRLGKSENDLGQLSFQTDALATAAVPNTARITLLSYCSTNHQWFKSALKELESKQTTPADLVVVNPKAAEEIPPEQISPEEELKRMNAIQQKLEELIMRTFLGQISEEAPSAPEGKLSIETQPPSQPAAAVDQTVTKTTNTQPPTASEQKKNKSRPNALETKTLYTTAIPTPQSDLKR